MSLNYGEGNITMTTRSYSEEHPKKRRMGSAQLYQYNSYIGQNYQSSLLIDVAIPNSHCLHSAITERLQKCTDLKEELIRIW